MDYICVHLVSDLLPGKPSIQNLIIFWLFFLSYFLSGCFYQSWKVWIFFLCISFPPPNFLLLFFFFKTDKSKHICRESNNFAASEEKKESSWVTESWVLADKIRCQKCYKTNQMSNGWTVAALGAWRRCGESRLRTPIPAFVRSRHFSVTSSASSALIGAAFDSRQLS